VLPVLAALVACPEVLPPARDAGAGPALDAGADAGPADAGPADAGVLDDAGPAPADAGPDTGVDAGPLADAGGPAADGGVDGGPSSSPDAGATLLPGSLAVSWIHGADDCGASQDPPLQVHAYNDDTWILRQSKCVNFEGPFLFLLVGSERALLLDTGATSSATTFPVRATVEQLLSDHLGALPRDTLEPDVPHTHAHGDHRQGDGQFAGQPNTTLVGTGVGDVEDFFGFTTWPDDAATFDLGGRVLDVLPIPGHEASHIALYDRATGILLTGDSLYPGYLFIPQWQTYRASIARLAAFASQVPVSWVLGTHVEMTSTAGQAYTYGTTYQPAEHVLQLELEHLLELDAALLALGGTPTTQVHDDFIISP
jgi:glyoxylase-like metal-dependent hydrolase (beta-lactamase superfamily II)